MARHLRQVSVEVAERASLLGPVERMTGAIAHRSGGRRRKPGVGSIVVGHVWLGGQGHDCASDVVYR